MDDPKPQDSQMRAYIRHPADVPIELTPASGSDIVDVEQPAKSVQAQDISLGGLSLKTMNRLEVGSMINVRIPVVDPPFETVAKVIWCIGRPDRFEVGIKFMKEKDAYSARMVEQVCHIEHYRQWVREVEGRDLNGEDAAAEWIGKFAKDFPGIDTEH